MQNRKLDSTNKDNNLHYLNHDNDYFRQDILFAILSLLHEMTNRHDRVFFMMFSLNLPSIYNDNNLENDAALYRFIDSLTAYSRRKMYAPRCLWTRKNTSISNTNYHFMYLFNFEFVQAVYLIIERSTELWAKALGVEQGKNLVHLCSPDHNNKYSRNFITHGGVLLDKKGKYFAEAYIHCFNLASYMAMRSSNVGSSTYVNEYGCS